ncbi:Cof-type HAD-IIB family hydrolase [Mycoplasmopsis pulmonis]|nr:Cof-type HAD-IIB family hydrolase [Mycoplasmopsis pulmonis]MDZ7293206.1 Cof-type HAD-IIB family hydrolase [Mycoplasmopsis pulmonis]
MYFIFTDLDGTLYDKSFIPSDKNKLAIKKAQEKGIEVVIATGNPFSEKIKNIALDLNINYVVTSNGAYIHDMKNDKALFKNHFSKKQIEVFKKTIHDYPVEVIYVTQEAFYSYNASKERAEYVNKFNGFGKIHYEKDKIENSLKIEYFTKPEDSSAICNILKENDFECAKIKDIHLEITPKNSSKGSALKFLVMDHFKQENLDKVMAIGDSANDSSMFELVKFSYAMDNSNQNIKNQAKFFTSSVSQHGVAEAIYDFMFRNDLDK